MRHTNQNENVVIFWNYTILTFWYSDGSVCLIFFGLNDFGNRTRIVLSCAVMVGVCTVQLCACNCERATASTYVCVGCTTKLIVIVRGTQQVPMCVLVVQPN